MLVLEPTAPKRSSIWMRSVAYTMLRDAAAIGRIELSVSFSEGLEARITLREQPFAGRIHVTGKARWTYVPARWVMYSRDTAVHGATCESGKLFRTEAEKGMASFRLRRERPSDLYAVERASDASWVGEIRWVRRRVMLTSTPHQIVLDTSIDLPETFEVLLLWIAVQDDFKNLD